MRALLYFFSIIMLIGVCYVVCLAAFHLPVMQLFRFPVNNPLRNIEMAIDVFDFFT